jgi:hypothetical protein
MIKKLFVLSLIMLSTFVMNTGLLKMKLKQEELKVNETLPGKNTSVKELQISFTLPNNWNYTLDQNKTLVIFSTPDFNVSSDFAMIEMNPLAEEDKNKTMKELVGQQAKDLLSDAPVSPNEIKPIITPIDFKLGNILGSRIIGTGKARGVAHEGYIVALKATGGNKIYFFEATYPSEKASKIRPALDTILSSFKILS